MLQILEQYRAGPKRLRALVAGLVSDQLQARPIEGKWSTLEVVCHLADSEALFCERMKRVLTEDRPLLLFADPTNYPVALFYQQRDVADELNAIDVLRRQMNCILRAQPPAAWQRVGIHSNEGEQTLEQLVRKAINHLAHHLRHIADKRAALESQDTDDG